MTNAILDSISQATNPATSSLPKSTSTAGNAATTLAGDFNSFLMMLTTQLKNQDPTSPLDTNQFTQQLVAFSGVEQAVNTNKNLETLISMTGASQAGNAVSYIGRTVDAEGNQSALANKRAEFAYDLPQAAASVSVSIMDGSGKAVFTGNGPAKAGKNIVVWDGVNSFNGTDSPDGNYSIAVTAKDATGKAISATTYTTGVVTSVDMQNGVPTLSLQGIPVTLDKVKTVRDSAVVPTQTA